MGYFSKTCAKTHLPVVVADLGIPHLNNVIALLPDGRKFSGSYDGYGRVDGEELHDDWDEVKFVLKDFYDNETYTDLGKSGNELAQGFFMDKQFLHFCIKNGPFKSRSEYTRAFKKYANW
jgi:hypothetical protein